MNRVVVIDAARRGSAADWWRWGIIALAATVLCSCSSLHDANQTTPLRHALRLRPIEEPANHHALAPVVLPDRAHGRDMQLLGDESIVVEDAPVEVIPIEELTEDMPVEGMPIEGAPIEGSMIEPDVTCVVCAPTNCSAIYPRDEYLCDGGDGAYLGSVDAIDGEGIEPSDTIAQFDSEFSRGHVVPSNRVCIYAPRFAATRKVIHVRQDESYSRVGGLHEGTQARTEAVPTLPNDVIQDVAAERQVAESIKHELQDATSGLLLDDTDAPAESGRRELPFESRGTSESRQLDEIDRVVITQQDVSAIQWTDIQAVELAIDGRPAHAVSDVGAPSDVYVFEVNRKPRLRLTKTLSSHAAEPGEEVLITIRFENIGDSPIENLRIVDNLTTRLEFVPDSDFCSHRALFSVRDNTTGSSKLLWEVRETIRPGQAGEVRFRCRVR